MKKLKVSFGNDHAAYEIKKELINYLENELNLEIINVGTDGPESVDYPDFAVKAAKLVADKKADFGIVICGTGIGISISANKVKGIRCALCFNEYTAKMARNHNDANMLAMGARTTSLETMKKICKIFFTEKFEGGRHERRVKKIMQIENM